MNINFLLRVLCVLCGSIFFTQAHAQPKQPKPAMNGGPDDVYKFESLPEPEESKGIEVGGMGWTADGKLALCTRHGEIWLRSMDSGEWTRLASGLHECLGLLPGESRGGLFDRQQTE